MKIEKLDRVVIYVKDFEDAKKFFGDLFETSFTEVGPVEQDLSGAVNRAAITPFLNHQVLLHGVFCPPNSL